jgi:hypothetical protein
MQDQRAGSRVSKLREGRSLLVGLEAWGAYSAGQGARRRRVAPERLSCTEDKKFPAEVANGTQTHRCGFVGQVRR